MLKEIQQEVNQVSYLIEHALKEESYTLGFIKDDKKKYLVSKYMPRQKAVQLLPRDMGNKSTVWILYGFYFGYTLEELFNKVGHHVKVLIIEPNKALLYEQMALFVHKEWLEQENVQCITVEEIDQIHTILSGFIPTSEFKNINMVHIEEYLAYYTQFFQVVNKAIYEFKVQAEVSYNTSLLNEKMYLTNTIKNRKSIQDTYDLSKHRSRYKDIPALIVGAGPSLSKNIEEIRDFKGIIFVVGRTIEPLIKRGVNPDFVFLLDPTEDICPTFGEYIENDIPLITLVNAHHEVIEKSKGKKYFLHNSTVSSGVLGLKVNPCLDLMGSVTTLCLSTAKYMGCNPIMFIGQDLAFCDGKIHSEEALGTEDKELNETIDTSFETVRGYYGDKVTTSSSWMAILSWIENFMKHHDEEVYGADETTYINATEGGAYIEGAVHIPFKQAISEYCKKEKPTIEHVKLEANKEVDTEENLLKNYKSLRNISRAVTFGCQYYKALLEEYVRNEGKDINKVRSLLEKIKRVDQIIMESYNANVLVAIIMRRIKEVLTTSNASKEAIDETTLQQRIRTIRLNCETYEQLVEESQMLLNIIEGELKK